MKFIVLIASLAAAVLAAPRSTLVTRDSRENPEIPSIDDNKFIGFVLDAHWYWRRIHCAQDLQWNATLAKMAQDDHRAGSNLSGQSPAPAKRDDWIERAREFVHGWHEEEMFYDYSTRTSKNNRQIYHFSQLVWRDSSQLGCAMSDCTDVNDASFPARLFCYYDPIGNNIAGNFMAENVWPPICADPSRAELEARYGF